MGDQAYILEAKAVNKSFLEPRYCPKWTLMYVPIAGSHGHCLYRVEFYRFRTAYLGFWGNCHAAKLAGVHIKAVKASAYVISGLLAGIVAIVLVSQTSTGQPI
jgi:ribose/xylose/arabinose/galactoside ABC-type transport system permease subunit